MNKQESDILRTIFTEPFINQRILSETSGHSLGVVNRSIRSLINEGYLDEDVCPTAKARREYNRKAPKNAIILAAGFGMRMAPINLSAPKGLLEVNGEPLIERIIKQLREVGVKDVTIVVGFMKESFDYLIDEYDVELVVNADYAAKNNLSSLALVADRLSNTYIVPSDIWCDRNPFNAHEMYSWYMVSDIVDNESSVRVNRKMELVRVGEHTGGNAMVGIAYLLEENAETIREKLHRVCASSRHDGDFWEIVLYKDDKMIIPARVVHASNVVEINTYEQLRELDSESNHLKSDALDVITEVFHSKSEDVVDINVLKKGMTNRSFLFSVYGDKYIMRIPGEGTAQLINRAQEAEVFRTIRGHGLCDDPVYINPSNGYKITKFLEGVRVCDPENVLDVGRCMEMLRAFHRMRLSVPHTFDIFGQIEFYEKLWEGRPSIYKDYKQTKANVLSLKPFIDGIEKDWCLTHIDAVPDNFLFCKPEGETEELLQLTDWEYAGMQDPHVDIAMFCIYSLYHKKQVDRLIDIYFQNNCKRQTRAKIYCYISMCGLLWSNWCEFKRNLGMEFGEYSLRQYRFAKDYYRYAVKEMSAGTHMANRAVIMAAGIGKRMRPLTLDVPKPLVKVNGVRMIDTVIKALHQNGIYEIYVVIGHLKEQFYEWSKEWDGVELIENPYYDTCNNISSLYAAREHLGGCIILDGDQLIYNSSVLDPHFTLSGYNSVWCEGETDEWMMDVEDGVIQSCSRTGGAHGWQLYSISRWTAEDGEKLRKHLEFEFERGNRDIYWDDVVMFCHFKDYTLGIKEMQKGDIIEIDDLAQLVTIDHSYQTYQKPNSAEKTED